MASQFCVRVGNNIKKYRKEAGITLKELGEKIGVQKSAIAKYENGQPVVENGEIAAVAIDDEATLKRFYRDGNTGTITLVAENPAYSPMVFTKESQKNVCILGKAIAFQSYVK